MTLAGRWIAFRADASLAIGSGHVMRCLTLAGAVAVRGGCCVFVMRDHTGHLETLVHAHRHQVHLLPAGNGQITSSLSHAGWLGIGWAEDAEQTHAALAGEAIDMIVVDNDALDANFEWQLAPLVGPIMVIDDLADRPHDCELLLDQNFGADPRDYEGLLPESARRLIVPSYALLQADFVKVRTSAVAARITRSADEILIAVSGVDNDNVSTCLLGHLNEMALPEQACINVVLGQTAPHVAAVKERAAEMSWPSWVLIGVKSMSVLIASTDSCIGAAVGMAWERCASGLPTAILILADRQIAAAKALSDVGAVKFAGDVRIRGGEAELKRAVTYLLTPEHRRAVGVRAADICDGPGAERVVDSISDLLDSQSKERAARRDRNA